MAISSRFPSARVVSTEDYWNRLTKAHHLMRQLQVQPAMELYAALLKSDIRRYFYQGNPSDRWDAHADPAIPSLNWACVYLGEYYMKKKVWTEWLSLADQFVFNSSEYDILPDGCKSRLISLKGWASNSTKHGHLAETIHVQERALSVLQLTDFEAAWHHMNLGIMYRLQVQSEQSLQHGHRAVELLQSQHEPFYEARAKANLAAAYYYFEDYDTSIEIYRTADDLAKAFGSIAETERSLYSLGWAYAESGQYALAQACFDEAKKIFQRNDLPYDVMLATYAEAFLCLKQDNFRGAVENLEAALAFFFGKDGDWVASYNRPRSVLMTATCLYMLADAYGKLGQVNKALVKAQQALYWSKHVDNLNTSYQCLYQLTRLSLMKRQWLLAARYGMQYRYLKWRMKK